MFVTSLPENFEWKLLNVPDEPSKRTIRWSIGNALSFLAMYNLSIYCDIIDGLCCQTWKSERGSKLVFESLSHGLVADSNDPIVERCAFQNVIDWALDLWNWSSSHGDFNGEKNTLFWVSFFTRWHATLTLIKWSLLYIIRRKFTSCHHDCLDIVTLFKVTSLDTEFLCYSSWKWAKFAFLCRGTFFFSKMLVFTGVSDHLLRPPLNGVSQRPRLRHCKSVFFYLGNIQFLLFIHFC